MKKILSLIMAGIAVLSMSTVTFAEEVPDFEKDISIGVELNEESTTQNVFKDVINIKESELKRTGETISLSKQRSDQTINNSYGVLPGTLTSTNTWDYYLFTSSTNFISYSKIATNNSYYTLTLGYVDYASGMIDLTDYTVGANQVFSATFEKDGNYAWVIQSSNATYGSEYKLQYNMSVSDVNNLVYRTNDLQKFYSIANGSLRINNVVQNLTYKYDSEWDLGSQWNKVHVWIENPIISRYRVGGTKYYASANCYDYPNSIFIELGSGGTFTHKFTQNAPYYDWGNKDASGTKTPRDYEGGGYLIYDLNTDKVVEFADGKAHPWSYLGDKHSLTAY